MNGEIEKSGSNYNFTTNTSFVHLFKVKCASQTSRLKVMRNSVFLRIVVFETSQS